MVRECYSVSRSLIDENNENVSRSWIVFRNGIVEKLNLCGGIFSHIVIKRCRNFMYFSYFIHLGSGSTGKKGVYEPDNLQRCQQVVCSPRKSIFIVSCFVLVIFIIALIAAFARPGSSKVGCISSTPPPISDATPTVATATNGEAFPWADIRLPDGVVPKTYSLFLHPNLTTFRFSGNVSILLEMKKKTNFLIYHSKELKITSQELLVIGSDGQTASKRIKILKSLEYVNHEQVYLLFQSDLEPGQAYRLDISFTGNLSDNLAGFYRSSYETSSGEKRSVIEKNVCN